jgi:putative transposase
VHDRYHDAEPLRGLTVKDEATGYCLAIKTGRHLQHQHVKGALRELITRYGVPRAIRSDNGSELLAQALRDETQKRGIELANIEPGEPWQNGSNESFSATFRKECLNAEIFTGLNEATVIIEKWRRRYNERRPHSSRNYITPEMSCNGSLGGSGFPTRELCRYSAGGLTTASSAHAARRPLTLIVRQLRFSLASFANNGIIFIPSAFLSLTSKSAMQT